MNDQSQVWQFYREVPVPGLGETRYQMETAGVFYGTRAEAVTELSRRIRATWSPFVHHKFEPFSPETP